MRTSIFALSLIAVLATSSEAAVIANLDDDFISDQTGWSYLWNPTNAPLGTASGYVSLIDNGGSKWVTGALDPSDDFTNSNNDTQDANASLGMQYNGSEVRWLLGGQDAGSSTDGLDHYFIAGYTIQPGQAGDATASFDGSASANGNGAELVVLVNDTVVHSVSGAGSTALDFTGISLGTLAAGDTVYFAARGLESADSRNNQRVFTSSPTNLSIEMAAIPEPSCLLLAGMISLGCLACRRRDSQR